jgi:RNA polymerase sigma-70 factor (ECF subfamily)
MRAMMTAIAGEGEEQAWQQIRQALRKFVLKRIGNPADADDIVHQALTKALVKLPQLRDEDRLVPWLYAIARNAITDHYRNSAKAVTNAVDELPEVAEDAEGDEEPCLHTCLDPLLDQLDAGYREALILADRDGMRQEEVAQRLGVSLSGAKSRVQRARRQLRRAFESCCRFEFDRRGQVIEAEMRTADEGGTASSTCCQSPSRSCG